MQKARQGSTRQASLIACAVMAQASHLKFCARERREASLHLPSAAKIHGSYFKLRQHSPQQLHQHVAVVIAHQIAVSPSHTIRHNVNNARCKCRYSPRSHRGCGSSPSPATSDRRRHHPPCPQRQHRKRPPRQYQRGVTPASPCTPPVASKQEVRNLNRDCGLAVFIVFFLSYQSSSFP